MKPKQIITVNPASGEVIRHYECHSPEELRAILAKAKQEQDSWRRTELADREHALREIAIELRSEKKRLAALMREEMGKLNADGEAEIEKCAVTADFYATNARAFLKFEPVKTEASKSFVAFEPLGTVLAIMPWNFPFWQALRCALPSIAIGNTVILKHASNVSGCSLAIAALIKKSTGRDLLQAVLLPGSETLPLIAAEEINAVSFTGSTPVGKGIAAAAGSSLKKCVLELGGSDPYLILEDADIDLAARICAQSRLINAGQSCISAKRFLAHKKISATFSEQLAETMSKTAIAPMARADLREELHEQVTKSISMGARLLCGGKLPAGAGYHYPPTVLSGVTPGMPAFDEELFGPVAAVAEAGSDDELVRLANLSPFGLGAAVFSRDAQKAERIALKELEAGSVFVNSFVRSDPRLPFGGIKESGYGRELSRYGLLEFANVKTVSVS